MNAEELRREYNKQRRRLQQFIRRATKRGYVFDNNVIPKKPKKITQSSISRLQKLTPDVLYKKAKYQTDEGKTVKGTVGRTIERKKAAQKARDTFYSHGGISKIKKGIKNIPKAATNVIRNVVDAVIKYSSADIDWSAYNQIQEMFDSWSNTPGWTDWWEGVKRKHMNTALSIFNGAIQRDGVNAVAKRLEENATKVIQLVGEILYGSGGKSGNTQDMINKDLIEFSQIVNNRALDVQQSAAIMNEVESNLYGEDDEV